MSKILLLTDTHLGARSSHNIVEQHILKFHEYILDYIQENNITQIFHLGDMFDVRASVNIKTLTLFRTRFFDVLKARGIKLTVICGNHDVYFRNTNEVNSLTTLLDTDHYPNITVVDKPVTIKFDSTEFLMVPWMQNQHYNEYKSIIENSSADILCAHLECSGFLMHAGVVSTDGMTMEPFQTFNKVLSGHYHSKSQRENIYYLGTAYDMSWADVFDKKYFHTIDTETMELVPYEYTDKLFNRIVYNDSVDTDILDSIKQLSLSNKFVKLIVRSKTDVLGFESVMSYISNQNPAELSVVDETILLNSAYKDSVVSDTVTNINVVISSAIDGLQDTDSIDKDKLKTLMKDIYDKTLQESII